MSVEFDFSGDVVLITGVGGALGSAVAEAFLDADATVCGADVVAADSEDFLLSEPDRIDFYQGDFTDEGAVTDTVPAIVDDHGGIDYLANIAGTWRGGTPIAEENRGTVRANAVMPSVIDTPMNREMMPDADHDEWVDPAEIADMIRVLCSDAADGAAGIDPALAAAVAFFLGGLFVFVGLTMWYGTPDSWT